MMKLKLPPIEIENITPFLPEIRKIQLIDEMHHNPQAWIAFSNPSVMSVLNLDATDVVIRKISEQIHLQYQIPRENILSIRPISDFNSFDKIEFIILRHDLAIGLGEFGEISIYYPYGKYTEFIECIRNYVKAFQDQKQGKFHLLTLDRSGSIKLKHFKLRDFKVNVEDNYNDDFSPIHKYLTAKLNTYGDRGLILLYGKPGTGKTTYLRYLTRNLEKNVIYIPQEFSQNLTNASFMDTLIAHPDCVLIIEDAEAIITDRKKKDNFSISALLNISDGLLSYCLNSQIICTFNEDILSIDPALLRKGRLIAMYEFRELEMEKARKLAKLHGIQKSIDGPISLADLFNEDLKGTKAPGPRKIGFSHS